MFLAFSAWMLGFISSNSPVYNGSELVNPQPSSVVLSKPRSTVQAMIASVYQNKFAFGAGVIVIFIVLTVALLLVLVTAQGTPSIPVKDAESDSSTDLIKDPEEEESSWIGTVCAVAGIVFVVFAGVGLLWYLGKNNKLNCLTTLTPNQLALKGKLQELFALVQTRPAAGVSAKEMVSFVVNIDGEETRFTTAVADYLCYYKSVSLLYPNRLFLLKQKFKRYATVRWMDDQHLCLIEDIEAKKIKRQIENEIKKYRT